MSRQHFKHNINNLSRTFSNNAEYRPPISCFASTLRPAGNGGKGTGLACDDEYAQRATMTGLPCESGLPHVPKALDTVRRDRTGSTCWARISRRSSPGSRPCSGRRDSRHPSRRERWPPRNTAHRSRAAVDGRSGSARAGRTKRRAERNAPPGQPALQTSLRIARYADWTTPAPAIAARTTAVGADVALARGRGGWAARGGGLRTERVQRAAARASPSSGLR